MHSETLTDITQEQKNGRGQYILKYILQHKYVYLLALFPVLFYLIFCYFPMYGIIIAFKEFMYNKGILGSPWVGLDNFERLFKLPYFYKLLRNTLFISFGRILFEFPVPILIALLLNELRANKLKRFFQTVYTFPNFISWVAVSGIIFTFFSSTGVTNTVLQNMGKESFDILNNQHRFLVLIFTSDIWKTAGWGSIIYLAAMSSINNELYEAAVIDGAGRLKQFLHVTWPGILPTVTIMLILSMGNVMNAGFDQIFNLYNPLVTDVSDILDTYIYRISLQEGSSFSFGAAIGLFKSAINFFLLITVDRIAKAIGQRGLY